MTDSAVATIPEGKAYHAFRGPRPVAWDQRSTLMQTGNALSTLMTIVVPPCMYSMIGSEIADCLICVIIVPLE